MWNIFMVGNSDNHFSADAFDDVTLVLGEPFLVTKDGSLLNLKHIERIVPNRDEERL